jgi:hypothetical protein
LEGNTECEGQGGPRLPEKMESEMRTEVKRRKQTFERSVKMGLRYDEELAEFPIRKKRICQKYGIIMLETLKSPKWTICRIMNGKKLYIRGLAVSLERLGPSEMHNDGIASGCDVIPPQMAKRVKR